MTQALHPQIVHHITNSLGWSELREVQQMAIAPILRGANTILLAPTAGGKTEAAFFPLMSRLVDAKWQGLSILYLSPIKALLNNQQYRLEKLLGFIGHDVGVWHGDVTQSAKRRMRTSPPSLMLTTPESLEGMLISTHTEPGQLFGDLRVVVIDEIHAFADDDRGWHLLGVLNRLARYAGRDIQRVGLSATVGNRQEIVGWLSGGSEREQVTVDPPPGDVEPQVKVDWVASLENAAMIIAKMHRGERRLVFCDSRLQTEKLARALRKRGVTTHVTHSSLSVDERRQTERAFSEGGPGVIVATSALELGIDIGSLDRVIQIDAPYSVASFLQRMGRTGRRPGTSPNLLFLAVSDAGFSRALAIIDAWQRGEVESAVAPRKPYHIAAQQILATVLERPGLAAYDLVEHLDGFCRAAGISRGVVDSLREHLMATDYVATDGIRLGVGRSSEAEYGRRNFLKLVSVFTSPPIFSVRYGRKELGSVDQSNFMGNEEGDDEDNGPMVILLGGRSWRVTNINWSRRVAYVEPVDLPGRTRWVGVGLGVGPLLAQAHRRVFTSTEDLDEYLSQRALRHIEGLDEEYDFVDDASLIAVRADDEVMIWTFAGIHANLLLADLLSEQGVEKVTARGLCVVIRDSLGLLEIEELLDAIDARGWTPLPSECVEHPLIKELKFRELLPESLLLETAQAKLYDSASLKRAFEAPRRFVEMG